MISADKSISPFRSFISECSEREIERLTKKNIFAMVGKNSTTAYFELASKGFYTIYYPFRNYVKLSFAKISLN